MLVGARAQLARLPVQPLLQRRPVLICVVVSRLRVLGNRYTFSPRFEISFWARLLQAILHFLRLGARRISCHRAEGGLHLLSRPDRAAALLIIIDHVNDRHGLEVECEG